VLRNASGVLKAVDLLQHQHPVSVAAMAEALCTVVLRGRFQRVEVAAGIELVIDVAHNAQAVDALVASLRTLPPASRTQVLLGMLSTKDRLSAMTALAEIADHWHLATVQAAKGASAAELEATWQQLARRAPADCHASVDAAYRAALAAAQPGERIVAVGSFITVGEVLRLAVPDAADCA